MPAETRVRAWKLQRRRHATAAAVDENNMAEAAEKAAEQAAEKAAADYDDDMAEAAEKAAADYEAQKALAIADAETAAAKKVSEEKAQAYL
eukprot:14511757-Heterocapsa_arctica.AAC.1